MEITVNTGDGKAIRLSDEVLKVGADSYHVPQRDVLEAFKKCSFQQESQVKTWIQRIRDAGHASRAFLLRGMVKQHACA